MLSTVRPLEEAFREALAPEEDLRPSEWAAKYRMISSEAAGNLIPWRNEFAPFMVEPMDTFHPDNPSEMTVVKKSIQVCASETMNNLWGWIAHSRKKSQILALGTIETTEDYSDLRIKTMIRDTPVLAKIIAEETRDATNKKLLKNYPGGYGKMCGANSPVSMRSHPVPYLLCDEVSGWTLDAGEEGAPLDLLKKRTYAFADHKIWLSSTPNVTETCVISENYDLSSQGQYQVPCPFCGKRQVLQFSHLVTKGRETPAYECEHCNTLIDETYKYEMLLAGKWVHRFPDNSRIRGFAIDGMYSPVGMFNTWGNMVYEHQKAMQAEKARNKKPMVAFRNTLLGLPVSQADKEEDEPDVEAIQERCEVYPDKLPECVKLLTCAVDVQGDRLEYEIVAWGPGKENWSWEWAPILGSPGLTVKPNVWTALKDILGLTFMREDGAILGLSRMCVDTGGHFSNEVYAFCRQHKRAGAVPVKGYNVPGRPLVTYGQSKKGQSLVLMGTETAKDTMYDHLKIETPGPCYCHFPKRPEYDDEYFKQLFAEEKISRKRAGRMVQSYVARRKRNEKCDLRVMNYVGVALADHGGHLLAINEDPVKESGRRRVISKGLHG